MPSVRSWFFGNAISRTKNADSMPILDMISDRAVWESFYDYKCGLSCPKRFTSKLRSYIDEERYLPAAGMIREGRELPPAKRSVISKMGSLKKRVVYTYPDDLNTVMKLITYLMLRRYDGIFADDLYSFRPGRMAKDAVGRIVGSGAPGQMYSYKVDISDYFNSIPVELLLPMLKSTLADDPSLYGFIEALLTEPNVTEGGRVHPERKGIMAGTPISSFLANLYLADLDRRFEERGVMYARYSDDIIVFAETHEKCADYAEEIREFLAERRLTVNPKKESFCAPGENFSFLGFGICGDRIDIAPATVQKIKGKMRRKRDSLARWKKRNEAEGERAARAFIRMFNRKFFEGAGDNELTWSRWFFPTINTTDSLHEIDQYAQDCIRYLVSGKHTKARYNVRYEDMKALGYRSLVHEYFSGEK